MVEGIDSAAAGTFGRDAELSRLGAFVRGADSERALFVEGAPGLGKTTLWESAREAASAGGVRVLAARAAEAETSMSYAVLSDLLADVDVRSMATIPEPQREAIEVALLRAQPSGSRIESRAVPLGVVNMLRALADAGPVLLAIDDLQWVDNATAEALAFALRRVVGDSRVRLLATRRPEGTRAIEAAVAREASATISLTGLTLGATRRLLHARYGLALSRRVARRVHELTLGNPLFALEIGRLLAASGSPPASGDLEVPDSLEELLGERLRSSPVARRAMLAVALGGSLGQDQIASVAGQDAFDAALEAGLLVRQAGRVAPGHPLLAASVIKRSSPADRRSMHGALARVTVDQVRRAHHLAEAATEPGAELAETVAAGASEAATRGAIDEAIELAEQALRLTPPGSDDRPERVLTLGEYLLRGVEPKRLRELMSVELDALPRGTPKARGHLLAAHVPVSQEEYDANLACVLHESEDPRYRVMALVEQSLDATVSYAERLTEAEARAAEALALGRGGPAHHAALYAAAWVRVLRGRPIDDLAAMARAAGNRGDLEHDVERARGIQLAFRGRVHEARSLFSAQLDRSESSGDLEAWASLQHQLSELEARIGNRLALDDQVFEGRSDVYLDRLGTRAHSLRLMTLSAALRGDFDATERLAAETRDLVTGQRWDLLEIDRALGIAALAGQAPARAIEPLVRVWRHVEHEEIGDPGAFPVAPDLVEAALGVGDRELASTVTARLRGLSGSVRHPWGIASTRRCEAMLVLAEGDSQPARRLLARAARRYLALGCRFDAARTLLTLGRHARRARKWAEARAALEGAASEFQVLGCDGWVDRARQQLAGLGGRRRIADPDALTPTERRVAGLASDGLTNKDIAATLFVGVHTIEVHLGRAYQKLGVRSRSQLASALRRLDSESPMPNI